MARSRMWLYCFWLNPGMYAVRARYEKQAIDKAINSDFKQKPGYKVHFTGIFTTFGPVSDRTSVEIQPKSELQFMGRLEGAKQMGARIRKLRDEETIAAINLSLTLSNNQ